MADRVFPHQVILGLGPVLQHVGQLLVVDHDQEVVVADIAADRIGHPVAARVAPEQHDLEDPALALVRAGPARDGVLELGEQHLGDALQLAPLALGQVLQAGFHHP
jgi:saccharopine dehydrogenase-like NADP-dependent oxidoreductase